MAHTYNYVTKPLDQYDAVFQEKAKELFDRVEHRVNEWAIKCAGSYSFLESKPPPVQGSHRRAGKIIIATSNDATRCRMPDGDGVYVLLRAEGSARAWKKHDPWTRADPGLMLTINSVRFYYFQLSDSDDLDAIADAIADVILKVPPS